MAARAKGGTRERRPAIWPWLVLPVIVLLVFYALFRVHQRPGPPVRPPADSSIAVPPGPRQL
jgi:hypothetical protein